MDLQESKKIIELEEVLGYELSDSPESSSRFTPRAKSVLNSNNDHPELRVETVNFRKAGSRTSLRVDVFYNIAYGSLRIRPAAVRYYKLNNGREIAITNSHVYGAFRDNRTYKIRAHERIEGAQKEFKDADDYIASTRVPTDDEMNSISNAKSDLFLERCRMYFRACQYRIEADQIKAKGDPGGENLSHQLSDEDKKDAANNINSWIAGTRDHGAIRDADYSTGREGPGGEEAEDQKAM